MDLVDAHRLIATPSRYRPASMDKVNEFFLNLIYKTDEDKYQKFFTQIPSNWTTRQVDKQFAFDNPGVYYIGDKQAQFLLINTGTTAIKGKHKGKHTFLVGLFLGRKIASSEMIEMQQLLDTALLVNELQLVLKFPQYKILNWVNKPMESLVEVE